MSSMGFLSLAGVGLDPPCMGSGSEGVAVLDVLSVQQLAFSRMDSRHLMTQSRVGAW